MNLSLTPELQKLVKEKVASGMYQTPAEVVQEGLRLLKERDEDKLDLLHKDVRAGFEQIERGKCTEYDEHGLHKLFEDVEAEGMKRLVAKRLKTK